MKCLRASTLAATGAAAAFAAMPATAQQQIGGGFSISGSISATTDYRFRGISESGGDPALQGTITLDHESGFYGGFWTSTLGDNQRLGSGEIDLYAGYTREIASGTDIDVGLIYYLYPNAPERFGATDYVEPYASISHTLGPVTAEVGAAYAPEQDAIGGEDNLYVYGDLRAGVPFTPVAVTAHVGRSQGGLAPGGDYIDWRIGLEATRGPATFSLDYVDTDVPGFDEAKAGLVLSVRLGF